MRVCSDYYCEYCSSQGHRESACPLLNPLATQKETAKSTAAILSSQDASLMEGLIDDQIVTKSFLVSLSADLLKHTESERSPFAAQQAQRLSLLATLHTALLRSRNQARLSKKAPDGTETSALARLVTAQTGPDGAGSATGSSHGGSLALSGASSSSSSLLLALGVLQQVGAE